MPENEPETTPTKEAQAKGREEKSLSFFEQPLLVKLDKIYNYQLKNDKEYDETFESIHLSLQSIKKKLERLN